MSIYRFGVDYYPEHWPQERWSEDAQMMQEAGINTVRMAEFAWSLLEPSPDLFEFAWLDQAISIMQEHGIQTVLGTPTASPPPWVMAMYPDAYRVRLTRHQANYGGRRDSCPTHSGYLERCGIITTAMAEHYAAHPAVIGWQTDNEFGRLCYCSSCQRHFQSWLRKKYESLDALNSAWGTVFWSHIYTTWEQIPLPEDHGRAHSYGPNPGMDLDFRRFSTDAVVSFQQQQVDILRQLCPDHFVTHNTGFGLDDLNFFDIADTLDFVSLDHYPREPYDLESGEEPAASAMTLDLMRGLKRKNFWMTEMQSGPSGWTTIGATPRPGEIRLWTYQAIAHGADAMIYFRWRTALFGAEQFWHGVLDHDGRPRRRYREIKQIGAELGRIGDQLKGASSRVQAAVVHSYDSRFAFQAQPNHDHFDYVKLLRSYYQVLYRRNIAIDIVTPMDDLSSYSLVVAPALHVVGEEIAANLINYVENGGTLVLTARSGVKTMANAVIDLPLPGLLADLCGMEVEEYDALPVDQALPGRLDLPGLDESDRYINCHLWVDLLVPNTAEVVARYLEGHLAGGAAATINAFGQGRALYVGSLGDDELHDRIVGWLLGEIGLTPVLDVPGGVEAVERTINGVSLIYLLNHSDIRQQVTLAGPMIDLLTGNDWNGEISLPPHDIMILQYLD